jgi:gamma-glutamyltranspeptidase/glutathione hydrolase
MSKSLSGLTESGHPQRVAYSKKGVVASAHYRASEAGARMFELGGNAVDAAIATALALSVCEPAASGLGGQTMMLIHVPGSRTVAIDGSSRAPHRTPPAELKKVERHLAMCSSTTGACRGLRS